jgi:serine O-acetyltransferase
MSHIRLTGYTVFSVLHSDLYAQLLYFAANSAWRELHDKQLATKFFCLNKALHGINCMYDTELPNVFLIIHGVGAVLGKARYSDYLVICQNVTVGADRGEAPTFSNGTYLGPGSAVVGRSVLGSRTVVALNTTIRGESIAGDCVVSGQSPNLSTRPIKRDILFGTYFDRGVLGSA